MKISTALKDVRLSTPLLLKDVCALLGLSSWSKLSRVEAGKSEPSWEILFAYHLIFSTPLDRLLPGETMRMKRLIRERTLPYLNSIELDPSNPDDINRVSFLQQLYEQLKN